MIKNEAQPTINQSNEFSKNEKKNFDTALDTQNLSFRHPRVSQLTANSSLFSHNRNESNSTAETSWSVDSHAPNPNQIANPNLNPNFQFNSHFSWSTDSSFRSSGSDLSLISEGSSQSNTPTQETFARNTEAHGPAQFNSNVVRSDYTPDRTTDTDFGTQTYAELDSYVDAARPEQEYSTISEVFGIEGETPASRGAGIIRPEHQNMLRYIAHREAYKAFYKTDGSGD